MNNQLRRLTDAEIELKYLKERTGKLEYTLKELRRASITSTLEQTAPPPIPKTAPAPVKQTLAPSTPIKEKPRKSSPVKPAPKPLPVDTRKFELQLGRVWFVRLGILLVLTGLVFLGNYAYKNYVVNFGPGLRLSLLYTVSFLLTGAGIFCDRWKESLKNYGRTLASGGLAAAYYTTFAAHNVSALRVIESPVAGALLLGLSALLFVGYAQWKNSSATMSTALGLAFYSTAINPVGWMACLSALLLASLGIAFLIKNRWTSTGFVSLVGAYVSFAWWQYVVGAPTESTRWFLPAYWTLFTVAIFLKHSCFTKNETSLFSGINNGFLFSLFSLDLLLTGHEEQLWIFAMLFSGILFCVSALRKMQQHETDSTTLTQAISLLTLGFILKLSGHQLFLVLALESLALLISSARYKLPVLRTLAIISACISGLLTVIALEAPAAVPTAAWIFAPILWLSIGKAYQHFYPDDGDSPLTLAGTPTALMAIVTLCLGALQPLDNPQFQFSLIIAGIIATTASRDSRGRLIGMEFLWGLQAIAALSAISLIEYENTLWVMGLAAGLSLTLLLINWLSNDEHLTKNERHASQLFQYLYLTLTTIFVGLGIDLGVQSPPVRALLYVGIPLVCTLLAQRYEKKMLQLIPGLLHLGLVPVLSQSPALPAFIATIGLSAQYALMRDSNRVSAYLLAAIPLFYISWIFKALPMHWELIALSLSGMVLFCSQFKNKISDRMSILFFLLPIFISMFNRDAHWVTYCCLALPTACYFWKKTRTDLGSFEWIPVITLLVLWLRISWHTWEVHHGGLAVAWAITGTVSLLIGLVGKSRNFRFTALAMLAASLGHVAMIDVWKLDPLPRILSLLSLGIGLLLLGFVYNRWHERLKRYL